MRIFAATYIKDKKSVWLVREKFYNKTKYEISLAVHASKYIDYRFKNLHIVDLNGALKWET